MCVCVCEKEREGERKKMYVATPLFLRGIFDATTLQPFVFLRFQLGIRICLNQDCELNVIERVLSCKRCQTLVRWCKTKAKLKNVFEN